MFAVVVGFVILWLALSTWVYFDATERGKPSIVWAGGVFLLPWLGVIVLILYLIFRDTGQRVEVPPGAGRRQYLYIVSFAGLATLMVGLVLLLTTTIVRAMSEGAIDDDGYRQALASSIAAIIVGLLVWATHWFRAERRLASLPDDQEFRAAFYLHRAYIYTVFGLSWIIMFIAGLWLLGGGLANAFGVEDVEPEGWVPALGPALIALLVIAFHYLASFETLQYKEFLARFETVPPPPMIGVTPATPASPAATAAARTQAPAGPSISADGTGETRPHCTNCGAQAGPGDAFCASCGAALHRAGA
jgi:hypothetical protein